MKNFLAENLLDLNKTKADTLFKDSVYPWEVLSKLKDFILELGKSLPKDEYDEIKENVWIAKNAVVAPTAYIGEATVIGHETEIRHCAFIRGSALIGESCVVGNSVEIKNAILFDGVQVPHFNYVGDSILGFKAHLGAGVITSNVKSDRSEVTVLKDGKRISTGLKKFGALLGDFTEVGCNAVLNPGSVLGRNCTVYPTAMFRGFLEENSIFKNTGEIVKKR